MSKRSCCPDLPEPSLFTQMTPKNSEYDQEISQSQTAHKPMAPQGGATQQSRDARKTN